MQRATYIRLTALWAFVEAGLGGFLHALHLPFTGLVLGGFAVLIISLLAQYSKNIFRDIIAATLVVVAIKAMVNPSTPAAFVAVLFQGLLGAIIYSVHRSHWLSHLLFACLSMLESAAQKLLMMTIFFGKTFWQGLDGLGQQVANIFGYATSPTSHNIIIVYLGIFFVWGLLLAAWMHVLPNQLSARKNKYQITHQSATNTLQPKRKSYFRILLFILIVVGLASYLWQSQSNISSGILYLLRTLAILSIWQLWIVPIWATKIKSWSEQRQEKDPLFHEVQSTMPSIASSVPQLYQQVNNEYNGVRKWREFILALISITIYPPKA